MKVVALADTHTYHTKVEVPDGDVLIFAGDMCSHGEIWEVEEFALWFNALPHKNKIVVAGNHDWPLFKTPSETIHLLEGIYLQDDSCFIDGVCFYGSPWTPEFCYWAFMKKRGDDIKAQWDSIFDCTDVLVTHGPPLNILDSNKRENVGCWDLRGAVEKVKPKYHIFGHIHEAHGVEDNKDTVFANVSICDGLYDPCWEPYVFEVERRKA